MDSNDLPNEGVIRVDVTGNNQEPWRKLRSKLLDAFDRVVNTVVDSSSGATVRDEAMQLTTAAIENCKQKLQRAGLENDKIEAEVHRLYAERESVLASARKTNAEADALEFSNSVKRLQLMLTLSKAMVTGDQGQEAIIFSNQIDEMVLQLKAIGDMRP